MMTFNPGWTSDAQPLGSFTDVRDIQKALKANDVDCLTESDATTTGASQLHDPRP